PGTRRRVRLRFAAAPANLRPRRASVSLAHRRLEVFMSPRRFLLLLSCISCLSWSLLCLAQEKVPGPPLPGTQPLTMDGDIAAQMVAGIDKFLLREIEL